MSARHTSRGNATERLLAEHCDLAHSYLLVAPPGTFFAGVTAAVLIGLPVPFRADEPLAVARFSPHQAPRGRGVHGVQVRPWLAQLVTSQGLPVTCPLTTWAMLGRRLSLEQLVVLGDAIVAASSRPGRRPLGTLEGLRTVAKQSGRRGAPVLRQAVSLVRVGAASPPETLLRLALCAAGLPEPTLDVVVRRSDGRVLGRSELAYREHRIALGYESEHHRVDPRQWNRDINKYQSYMEAGWRVVRVTSQLLFQGRDELVRRVAQALDASAQSGPGAR